MTPSVAVDPDVQPHIPHETLRSTVLAGAAGLMGFGLIVFIAANWDVLGRFERFGLVGAVVAAGALAATASSLLRLPGLLLATAGTGGMLALIGQTYQTGADPWTLFALWAALTAPWAIAARSDAAWTPWSVIAMTAIALWFRALGLADIGWHDPAGAFRPWSIAGVPVTVLASWFLSLGVAAAMVPWPPLDNWLGSRRWAFRLSLALTICLVTSHAVTAVIAWPSIRLEIFVAGLLLLAAVATWLATAARRDILLIAATALAIDAILIVGFARMLSPYSRHNDIGNYILIGIVAAAIVAVSVVAIMRLVGSAPASHPASPEASAPAAIDSVRPWPVVVLSGIGALIAAIPFIVATGILLGRALAQGPATYVIAAAMLPLSLQMIRKARSLFVEQLAIVGLATGLMLLTWSLFRDLPDGVAGLMCGLISLALAIWLGRSWLAALLGAAATIGFAIAIHAIMPGSSFWSSASTFAAIWSLVAAAGVAVAHAVRFNRCWLSPLGQLGIADNSIDATLSGWIAASLAGLALSSGTTFLLAAHLGGGASNGGSELFPQMLIATRGLSLVLAAGAGLWLANEMPSLRSPLALALLATATGLSIAMPSLGATVLVLALAVLTGRRALAIAAGVAGLWIIGAFYYNLALPLTHKAAILAASGAVLAIAGIASGARLGGIMLPAAPGASLRFSVLARALAAIGLILVAGVSADAIRAKEALIRNGAPVFVELVPVDPRSLMQGDYMALRFELPAGIGRPTVPPGPNPVGIGKRDGQGVLRVTRIGNAATPLASDEMKISLRLANSRWIVVTDAWFFKEGTAEKWTAARFGEFRVTPDGSALLVGLADKDRIAIK